MIEARVPPEEVWAIWERAHNIHGSSELESGEKGKSTKFRYKILDVEKGKHFSILWKTLFIHLIFTHEVIPTNTGSKISYRVQIKGLFAWPVRYFLGEKIRNNIRLVLKAIVRELESKSVK